MDSHHKEPNYVLIWAILIAMTLTSIAVGSYISLKGLAILLLFVLAAIKATLVALNFMHLKFEKVAIISFVIIPLVFFLIFLFGSMPDTIATKKTGGPKPTAHGDHH